MTRSVLDYLKRYDHIDDPQLRFAEDAVVSAAARSLKFDFSAEIYLALRRVAEIRCTPGVLDALTFYRREDCVPLFIEALKDDICRPAALNGLRYYGDRVRSRLLAEGLRGKPASPDPESTSSLYRRRCSLELLRELRLSPPEHAEVLSLLTHHDPELVLQACAICARSVCSEYRESALERLQTLKQSLD